MQRRTAGKALLCVALTVSSLCPVYAQQTGSQSPESAGTHPATNGQFHLEDGTPVKLRLQRTVSSADAQVNDQIDFDVLEEVKVSGEVVIPKGSLALGTVTAAQPKRRMGRGGKLDVNIDSVRLEDGEKCPLRAVKEAKGGGHSGAMTAGIVATGLIVWPAAPFFLFMHGKDITIPKGTEITAYINGDMTLDPVKFSVTPPTPRKATLAESASELVTVVVKSTPDGADILIDGKFAGSTPSTLRVAPGDHTISIQKDGFKPWQRTVTVVAGSDVTINESLAPTGM